MIGMVCFWIKTEFTKTCFLANPNRLNVSDDKIDPPFNTSHWLANNQLTSLLAHPNSFVNILTN